MTKRIAALLAALSLSACAGQYVPVHGQEPEQQAADVLDCRAISQGLAPSSGGGGFYASGSSQFVRKRLDRLRSRNAGRCPNPGRRYRRQLRHVHDRARLPQGTQPLTTRAGVLPARFPHTEKEIHDMTISNEFIAHESGTDAEGHADFEGFVVIDVLP
jgi:hypothetical protein